MNNNPSVYGTAYGATGEESVSSPPLRSGETGPELQLLSDMTCYLQNYARQRPEVAAMWCFGIGFVLGWRLKPW